MNLPSLRELRLNDNVINTIRPMAFLNVPELQFLYLRYNLIADLDGGRLNVRDVIVDKAYFPFRFFHLSVE